MIKNARYLKGMTNKSEARIISIKNPHDDYYVITLKPAEGFHWEAGEHVMVKLPNHPEVKKEYRMLSIASLPEEGVIMFGTRTRHRPSEFKKVLLSLLPDDVVAMQGAFGWFRIRDDVSPIVIYAGGVGITPVRPVLKELEKAPARPVHVVYASSDYYLFEKEIREVVDRNPMMSLDMVSTAEESQAILARLAEQYGNKAYYFVSSSPAIIDSVSKLLKGKGISGKRLIDDAMRGY